MVSSWVDCEGQFQFFRQPVGARNAWWERYLEAGRYAKKNPAVTTGKENRTKTGSLPHQAALNGTENMENDRRRSLQYDFRKCCFGHVFGRMVTEYYIRIT